VNIEINENTSTIYFQTNPKHTYCVAPLLSLLSGYSPCQVIELCKITWDMPQEAGYAYFKSFCNKANFQFSYPDNKIA